MSARSSRSSSVVLASLLSLGGLGVAGLGCNWSSGSQTSESSGSASEPSTAPETLEGFLAELAPLPEGAAAFEITYTITGPQLEGEMRTILGPGGLRRDRWELRPTVGDSVLRASGTTVVTAETIWTAADGQAGEKTSNHLAGLAKAYLGRDEATRAKLIASIRTWHQTLADQRERAGGERASVAERSCLRTRIAAQNVCMWEEAGVMLEYEGSAFHIEASTITAIEPAPDAFTLPVIATQATNAASEAQDYDAILDAVAAGSYAQVSLLLYTNAALPKLPSAN